MTSHFAGGRISQQALRCRAKAEQRDGAAGSRKPPGSSLSSDLKSFADTEFVEADHGNSSAGTGSIFGAVALITGSSVGAGISALPAITAPTVRLPSRACQNACTILNPKNLPFASGF